MIWNDNPLPAPEPGSTLGPLAEGEAMYSHKYELEYLCSFNTGLTPPENIGLLAEGHRITAYHIPTGPAGSDHAALPDCLARLPMGQSGSLRWDR